MKRFWKLAPTLLRTLLRTLLIAILIVVISGVGMATLAAQRRGAQLPALNASDSRLIARALPGTYSVPTTCSVPIIPSILTAEELELRQFQADFAKYIHEQAKLDQEVAITTLQDVLAIEKFQLDCEIKVIQAQELLRAGLPQPTPEELAVNAKEVELRKRQLAIAKRLDDDEIIAHEAGAVSFNRVWAARRARIDAEILMQQATVKQKMLNEQRHSE